MIILDVGVTLIIFCYRYSIAIQATKDFELYDGKELDGKTVTSILRKHTTLGFNSSNYDLPVIVAAFVVIPTHNKTTQR